MQFPYFNPQNIPKHPNFTQFESVKFTRENSEKFRNLLTQKFDPKDRDKTIQHIDKKLEYLNLEGCGKVIVKNCEIGSSFSISVVEISGKHANVSFENCKFFGGQMSIVVIDKNVKTPVTFKNCSFQNGAHGIVVKNNSKIECSNCTFTQLKMFGIHGTDGANVLVKGCSFTKMRDGIILERKCIGRIFNTKISDIYETGIAIEKNSIFLHLNYVEIQQCYDIGILITQSEFNLIENCKIFNTSDKCLALKVSRSSNTLIRNCIFYKNMSDSLYIAFNELAKVLCENCTFTYNAIPFHIRFNGDGLVILKENIVKNNNYNEIAMTCSTKPKIVKQKKLKYFEIIPQSFEVEKCKYSMPENTYKVTDGKYRHELCFGCGKEEKNAKEKFKRCLRCLFAKYCSKECQKLNWKDHKWFCNAVKKGITEEIK